MLLLIFYFLISKFRRPPTDSITLSSSILRIPDNMSPAISYNHSHKNSLSLHPQINNLRNPNPNPNPSIDADEKNPKPLSAQQYLHGIRLPSDSAMAEPNNNASPHSTPLAIDGSDEDSALSKSVFLSRQEVLKRRSRRLKQLATVYKDHYWTLMDDLKHKYREYYWEYGKSPFQEDEERENLDRKNCAQGTREDANRSNNGNGGKLGLGLGVNVSRCAVNGCKAKAMALTKFCHLHILSDAKQKLYKGCNYVTKSAPAGPIFCMKPILRSTVPSLCPLHLQMAEKHLTRALKKAGLNVTSTSKLAPKLHVIVAEYVRQIQMKRRAGQKAIVNRVEIKEEKN
ncbi:uncharacterized protein LOC132271289 [Cornus florida]|uniref:uncharacterized protein LOC132271289 n=1 Tax=Cornus florida TaxID=4283 RepID=UPI00289F06A8|nr:uncharacterized protein LOC132271289 [Cornus florida]